MLKTYYWLTKPGIVYGNALAVAAGFLLAWHGSINIFLLLPLTLLGSCLVMASGCVLNNYIDRGIDAHMTRTKKRALVTGKVTTTQALSYGTFLGLLGFAILAFGVNLLAAAVGLVGFVFYVVLYGLAKRHSVHGTLVGSVSGAVPPVIGYVGASNQLDGGALLLFIIMTLWQMPHFYAIAMYRLKDYAAASLPVLPVKKGMRTTKIYILVYIALYIVAAVTLTLFNYTGLVYVIIMTIVGLAWLRLGIMGFKAQDDAAWARKMFSFSLIVLLTFCVMLSANSFLP